MLTLNSILQKAIQGIHKHLENWRKYQHLWKQDRMAILSKFVAKNPTAAFFEKKLEKYFKVSTDILVIPKDKSVEFIQISSHQLAAAVRTEALAWLQAIGDSMSTLEKERVKALHDKMDRWFKVLHQPPDSLENLKMVLNVVAEVLSSGMVVELE
jgi:dynein heavy chain